MTQLLYFQNIVVLIFKSFIYILTYFCIFKGHICKKTTQTSVICEFRVICHRELKNSQSQKLRIVQLYHKGCAATTLHFIHDSVEHMQGQAHHLLQHVCNAKVKAIDVGILIVQKSAKSHTAGAAKLNCTSLPCDFCVQIKFDTPPPEFFYLTLYAKKQLSSIIFFCACARIGLTDLAYNIWRGKGASVRYKAFPTTHI